MIDLSAYFERIQFGEQTPLSLGTISAILRQHRLHIPFENFDCLLNRPISLEHDALQKKLIADRRGGYCFEHATLMEDVLRQIGFSPVPHTGRVTIGRERDASPRTHMFLIVNVKGKDFVVDPGFASFSSPVPIPLMDSEGKSASNGDRWMSRDGAFWKLIAYENDEAEEGWISTLDVDYPIDFVLGNYYVCAHPKSPFRSWLMLNAFTKEGRVSVMNRGLTIVTKNKSEKRDLVDRKDLRSLVNQYFGFDLPEIDTIHIPAIPEWG